MSYKNSIPAFLLLLLLVLVSNGIRISITTDHHCKLQPQHSHSETVSYVLKINENTPLHP